MILKYLLTTLSICGLFCLFATPIVTSAASNTVTVNKVRTSTVVVDATTGKVKSPQKFTEANNLVTNEVICVRVDMFRNGIDTTTGHKAFYWSDAELKVLDKVGNLLYFATTSYNDVIVWHCPAGKETTKTKHIDNTWDSACVIYYYIAGTKYAQHGQCSSPKQQHEVSDSQPRSIGACEGLDGYDDFGTNHPITAIEFFPNINDTSIRDIFLNPENTIIVSRKNQLDLERTENGDRVWRPTIPQYYRK